MLFDYPADDGNLISGSSAFSKTSLNIWKFTIHVLLKPGLENFEHYFASMCCCCCCCCQVTSVVPDPVRPHRQQPTRLCGPWDSPGKNTGMGSHSLLQVNLPKPGIEPRYSALQAVSSLSEPPGKPKENAVSRVYRRIPISGF